MCKTADSLADYADSRRQKTGWSNGSAKADAADLADKDHIVEILPFMLFAVYLRNNAACCIHLRDLRYVRENNTQEDSSFCTMNPQCLSQISLITQIKDRCHMSGDNACSFRSFSLLFPYSFLM